MPTLYLATLGASLTAVGTIEEVMEEAKELFGVEDEDAFNENGVQVYEVTPVRVYEVTRVKVVVDKKYNVLKTNTVNKPNVKITPIKPKK